MTALQLCSSGPICHDLIIQNKYSLRMHLMIKFIAILSPSLAIVLLGSQNCYAQTSKSLNSLSDIYACADISDATERLACYDTSVGRLESAEKSGDIVALSRTEIDQAKKDNFGLKQDTNTTIELLAKKDTPKLPTAPARSEVKKPEKSKKREKREKSASLKIDDIDKVELEIERTKTFGYEKTRFYLTNGQVWDQVDNYRIRVPKPKDGNPNTAEIKKAALGSFFLRINGKGRAIRIRRKK